jgi:hypothetical protein
VDDILKQTEAIKQGTEKARDGEVGGLILGLALPASTALLKYAAGKTGVSQLVARVRALRGGSSEAAEAEAGAEGEEASAAAWPATTAAEHMADADPEDVAGLNQSPVAGEEAEGGEEGGEEVGEEAGETAGEVVGEDGGEIAGELATTEAIRAGLDATGVLAPIGVVVWRSPHIQFN